MTLPPHAGEMLNTALHNHHAREILKAIAHDIDVPCTKNAMNSERTSRETAAAMHGALRHSAGFGLAQLTAEFRSLRACVLRLWMASSNMTANEAISEVLRFNEAIDQALAEAVGRYMQEVTRAREMFLSVLGHDLRTPLGAIAITSQYLAMSNVPDNKRLEAAARIDRCVTSMNALIKDVLEYTRSRLGKGMTIACKPGDLAEVCRTACDDIRAVHIDVEFRCELKDRLDANFDPARMHQAIWNLLNSAVQQSDRQTPVVLTASETDEQICIRVRTSTSGRSLPAQPLQSIFDPMAQLSSAYEQQHDDVRSSIQLGLFVVREIIRAHQGEIAIRADGDETIFEATLMRHEDRY
jgi:signal transduction histidine kinase